MREQLIRYVDLLFAGSPNAYDIKQEILQNTLDRYDDLIAQGKSPEAAYSLSIAGIGDISELLGGAFHQDTSPLTQSVTDTLAQTRERKRKRAVAIAMYILCPVPLFILSEIGQDTMGLCLTLLLVAAATALMVLAGKDKRTEAEYTEVTSSKPADAHQELRNSIGSVVWAIGLGVYFILSFTTQAWYITWIVFPLIGSIQGLINACMDLKEAK